MDTKQFRIWLDEVMADKSIKRRSDMVSRAKRVESAFQEIEPSFSLDDEYKNDGGKRVINLLRCFGRELEGTGIKLPLQSNQMSTIMASAKWYFKYLRETGK